MRRALITGIVLACCLIATGCNKQADIAGTWREAESGTVFVYNADGSFKSPAADGTVAHAGTWKLIEKNGEYVLVEECKNCIEQSGMSKEQYLAQFSQAGGQTVVRADGDTLNLYLVPSQGFTSDDVTSKNRIATYKKAESGAVSPAPAPAPAAGGGPANGGEAPTGSGAAPVLTQEQLESGTLPKGQSAIGGSGQ